MNLSAIENFTALLALEDCPYYLISRVSIVVASALKKGFATAGVGQVKPSYLGVLFILWKTDGLKVIELGRKAGLEPSTMTGLLDRMERDGLAVRSADPHDRRAQLIFLTDQARHVKPAILGIITQTLAHVFKGISENELSGLKDILRRVLANAKKGEC